ncbi:SAVED domain-containing protein [Cystobacter fuscus]|nr:SAVED domain-containing protein [Cystobacter fuscus]
MPRTSKVEELSLEFLRKNKTHDPYNFSYEREEYIVMRSYGAPKPAFFPWDDTQLQKDLAGLSALRPNDLAVARIGRRLREFLDTADWAADEEALEKALREKRPVHLTIRSHAAELYYLPWELLPLRVSGTLLGELPDFLLRYQWPGTQSQDAGQDTIRILLACSAAGERVPFAEHREAIEDARSSRAGIISARTELSFLSNANRQSLALALRDPDRPIDVLHLLCHGKQLEGNTCGLVLNSEDREEGPDYLTPSDIRRLVSTIEKPPRLIVLCVCQSSHTGTPAHLLGSIAEAFHRQGIPAVIASRLPLSGTGSILFTKAFYEELLGGSGHLRTALVAARQQLFLQKSLDWASLQLYAREGDDAALDPFRRSTPAPRVLPTRSGELVLLCHEAYDRAYVAPGADDVPALFSNREARKVVIDQTLALKGRNWERLGDEVKWLLSPEGELLQLLTKRDTELVYYGFPYIPLAVLVGFLANTRPVHVVEYDREVERFTWMRDATGSFPPLRKKRSEYATGSVARLRLSISATVNVNDCEEVLPSRDVGLDLHFTVKTPQRGIVRREAQVQAYIQQIRAALDRYVAGNSRIQALHVFASVPVSIAFRLGQALAATGLPACCVYNYGAQELPRYKWRLWLRADPTGSPLVDVF